MPVGIVQVMPRIRCVPVDTNVLLKNIARDVRQWPNPTGLRFLGESGTLRPFAATHVGAEVDEKLYAWMRDRGCDPTLARRIWREHYLPVVRFVDIGTLGMDDPRVRAVLVDDPDDAPTAALASVLGIRALSEDHHLTVHGLASGQPWLEVIFAAGYVSFGETADFGLALGVSISGQAACDLVRAVQSLASTPGGRRIVVGAAVATVGLLLLVVLICAFDEDKRKWLTDRASAVGAAIASSAQVGLDAYVRLGEKRFEGAMRLEASTVAAVRPLGDVDNAARVLAVEHGALSTRELARRLWNYKRVPTTAARYLQELLSSYPAFVEVAPSNWQFGRRTWPDR